MSQDAQVPTITAICEEIDNDIDDSGVTFEVALNDVTMRFSFDGEAAGAERWGKMLDAIDNNTPADISNLTYCGQVGMWHKDHHIEFVLVRAGCDGGHGKSSVTIPAKYVRKAIESVHKDLLSKVKA